MTISSKRNYSNPVSTTGNRSQASDEPARIGYINIRGIVQEDTDELIKIPGQNQVFFPLHEGSAMHELLVDMAKESEDGFVEITLVADVRTHQGEAALPKDFDPASLLRKKPSKK